MNGNSGAMELYRHYSGLASRFCRLGDRRLCTARRYFDFTTMLRNAARSQFVLSATYVQKGDSASFCLLLIALSTLITGRLFFYRSPA